MDFQAMYKSKLTTAAEAVKLVKSGDWVDYTWCTNHPVALDKACVDAVNEQPIIDNSLLGMQRFKKLGRDNLYTLHPDTRWEAGIDQGAKIGLGSAEYELVKMK